MLVAYTIGKYRDTRGEHYVEQHRRRAEGVALELLRLGYAVICPHRNTGGLDGAVLDDVFLEVGLRLLEVSQIAVTVPGWDNDSAGSVAEVEHAARNRIQLYHWPQDRERLAALAGATTI